MKLRLWIMAAVMVAGVGGTCSKPESVLPIYLGGPYLPTTYQIFDIDSATGNIAVAGYTSDTQVLENSATDVLGLGSNKPIILLIERTNTVRWKQYLVNYAENVVALKFSPDGTFLVFTVENDPLKLFFLKASDGSSLGAFMQALEFGYQRDSRACYGNCIQFSHHSDSLYLAL